jgi:hypothetical protein
MTIMVMSESRVAIKDLSLAINPTKFAQHLGIDPDPWQRDLLLATKKHIILNCSRQSGKTTIVALLSLHHALSTPNSLVLVLSPSLRQSGELFKKITGFYKELGKPIPSQTETALTLQLVNNSRIVSLPGKEGTIRGFSGVSLLIIDEAARVLDDLYYAARPMLAVSNGRIIVLSTPYGKRGFFFNEWTEGEGWKKIRITAQECPRISATFLNDEKRAMPERIFKQEYFCEFSETIDQFFSYDEVIRAFTDEVRPLFSDYDAHSVNKESLLSLEVEPLDFEN